jgi:hypothetical protein
LRIGDDQFEASLAQQPPVKVKNSLFILLRQRPAMNGFVRGMHTVMQAQDVLIENLAMAVNDRSRKAFYFPIKKCREKSPSPCPAERPTRQRVRNAAGDLHPGTVQPLSEEMHVPSMANQKISMPVNRIDCSR